jgi:hypothetical protein
LKYLLDNYSVDEADAAMVVYDHGEKSVLVVKNTLHLARAPDRVNQVADEAVQYYGKSHWIILHEAVTIEPGDTYRWVYKRLPWDLNWARTTPESWEAIDHPFDAAICPLCDEYPLTESDYLCSACRYGAAPSGREVDVWRAVQSAYNYPGV